MTHKSCNNQAISDIREKARNIYNTSVNKTASFQRVCVGQLKELHKKSEMNCVADFYAMALFNLSLNVSCSESIQILADLEALYQTNQTKKIAEQIGRLKFNLSVCTDCDLKTLKQYAREIEQLYSQYPTGALAEPLAKIWYSIAISRAHGHLMYAQKIVDFCSSGSNPEANVAYAKVLFNPRFDIQNREKMIEKFLSQAQTFESFQEYATSPYYPEYNTALTGFKLYPIGSSKELVRRLNRVFNNIKRRSNYIDLKVEILLLFKCALKIKSLLIVPETEDHIGHYTRLENLKYLVLPGDVSGKLRMSNASYMNDPSEGETLIEFLSDGQKKSSDFYLHDSSNIYLSCFTTAIDELPMWSMYGNDGQGCCLVLKKDFFDHTLEDVPDDFLFCKHEKDERNYLYRVCYLSCTSQELMVAVEQFEEESRDDLGNLLSNEISELKGHYTKIVAMEEKKDPIVDKAIMIILDQIRYLFKSWSYAHERELRLVKYSENPLLDDKSYVVPQLYIEVEKPLEYAQIIFGPKVEQTNRITPYLMYTGKVKEVRKSRIQYR